jgi:hypothetical protein
MLPFRKDPYFVGRNEVLDDIAEMVKEDERRIALFGIGGVG